jgi:predicted small metal-binding protein
MKQFRCDDVVLGCEWVARNDDEGALFQEIQSHARDAHGMERSRPRSSSRSSASSPRSRRRRPQRSRERRREGGKRLRVRLDVETTDDLCANMCSP